MMYEILDGRQRNAGAKSAHDINRRVRHARRGYETRRALVEDPLIRGDIPTWTKIPTSGDGDGRDGIFYILDAIIGGSIGALIAGKAGGGGAGMIVGAIVGCVLGAIFGGIEGGIVGGDIGGDGGGSGE